MSRFKIIKLKINILIFTRIKNISNLNLINYTFELRYLKVLQSHKMFVGQIKKRKK